LKDVGELPSMEEFEKLVAESFQSDLLPVNGQASSQEVLPSSETAEERELQEIREEDELTEDGESRAHDGAA
jgi:hypothetical protein